MPDRVYRVRLATAAEVLLRDRIVQETFCVSVPYEQWKSRVNLSLIACFVSSDEGTALRATPLLPVGERRDPVGALIARQEEWYRRQYDDPAFTIDRTALRLSASRVEDICDAIARGENHFPLVVAPPRLETLTPEERSDPALDGAPRTLNRVLLDRLILAHGGRFRQETHPDARIFMDMVRDLTLEEFSYKNLSSVGGVPFFGRGTPSRFERDDTLVLGDPRQPFSRYLNAIYATGPRPAVTEAKPTIHFVTWAQDPEERSIPGDSNRDGSLTTTRDKSQLDAVRLRYPLITPTQYLVLSAMYRAWMGGAGHELDRSTVSCTFGIVSNLEQTEQSIGVHWDADLQAMVWRLYDPWGVSLRMRLRSSR